MSPRVHGAPDPRAPHPQRAREAAAALAALDRRGFLRLLAAGAALAWLPGCGPPAAYAPPPDARLRHLGPRSYAVLRAAAERVLGGRGAGAVAAGAVDPAVPVEAFLASAPDLASQLRQALLALEFAVWPLVPKLRPFTRLDGPGRDAVLRDLMASDWAVKRALFQGVRSVCLLGYYGSRACQPVSRLPGAEDATIADAMAPLDRG